MMKLYENSSTKEKIKLTIVWFKSDKAVEIYKIGARAYKGQFKCLSESIIDEGRLNRTMASVVEGNIPFICFY